MPINTEGIIEMIIERYCEKRLRTRPISARTVVRERKLKGIETSQQRSEVNLAAILLFGIWLGFVMMIMFGWVMKTLEEQDINDG